MKNKLLLTCLFMALGYGVHGQRIIPFVGINHTTTTWEATSEVIPGGLGFTAGTDVLLFNRRGIFNLGKIRFRPGLSIDYNRRQFSPPSVYDQDAIGHGFLGTMPYADFTWAIGKPILKRRFNLSVIGGPKFQWGSGSDGVSLNVNNNHFGWEFGGHLDLLKKRMYFQDPFEPKAGPTFIGAGKMRSYKGLKAWRIGFRYLLNPRNDVMSPFNPGSYNSWSIHLGLVFAQGLRPGPQVKKPAVYAYSETPLEARFVVDYDGIITFAHPTYPNNGWEVQVGPKNLNVNEEAYDYLFWEGTSRTNIISKEDRSLGFIVSSDSLTGFLEEQLTKIGLNDREQQDFIAFWGPILAHNEHNFIHFKVGKELDSFSRLKVDPMPDQMIRVYMLYHATDASHTVAPQTFIPLERTGFTVVEWGGALIDTVLNTP